MSARWKNQATRKITKPKRSRKKKIGGMKSLSKYKSTDSSNRTSTNATTNQVKQTQLLERIANLLITDPDTNSAEQKVSVSSMSPKNYSKMKQEILEIENKQKARQIENKRNIQSETIKYEQDVANALQKKVKAKSNWKLAFQKTKRKTLFDVVRAAKEQKENEIHICIPYPLLNSFTDSVPILPRDPFGGNLPVIITTPKQLSNSNRTSNNTNNTNINTTTNTANDTIQTQPGQQQTLGFRKKSTLNNNSASATAYAKSLSQPSIPYPTMVDTNQRRRRWPQSDPIYVKAIQIPYPIINNVQNLQRNKKLMKRNKNKLLQAIQSKNFSLVEMLIRNNQADPNETNTEGAAIIIDAAWGGQIRLVQILVDGNANVNAANKNGDTALTWAANKGFAEIIRILMDGGADLHHRNNDGGSALDNANSNRECLAELQKKVKKKVNATTPLKFPSPPIFQEVSSFHIPYPTYNKSSVVERPTFPSSPSFGSLTSPIFYPIANDATHQTNQTLEPLIFPKDPFSNELSAVSAVSAAAATTTNLNLIPYPLQVPESNTPPLSDHDLFLIEWQPKLTLLCQKYCPIALPKIPKLLKKYDNKAMILGYLNQKFFPKFQVSQDDQTTVCFLENGTIENENKNNIQFPLVPSWQLFQDTNHSFWKKQTFAYLDFTKNNESMGRVLIHLRLDICPITCQNFKGLCTHTNKDNQPGAPGYKNSEIHRIVLGFMIQGGDYELNNGTGGKSIWGSTFDDENFTLKHTRGAVSMANNGTNMNRSQWFICQSEKRCQNLDGKHVVFGYVVDGMNIVTSINQGATESQNGSKPKDCIMISDCGVLNWPSDEKNRSEVPSAKKKLLIW